MKYNAISTPEWFKRSAVYQINPRTFSKYGTITSVTEQLPFLASLGFKIMYLCPVFKEDESGDKTFWSERQKASMTENPKNPYRMNDYFSIDSEYGTMDELKAFIDESHRLGMRVLLDLVYLHIGPNAEILKTHPEFAKQNDDGSFVCSCWKFPFLDFNCRGLREYLYCNIIYYLTVFNADGFRCDVADKIPVDFWNEAKTRISAVKPDAVLIDEGPLFYYMATAFNCCYWFEWHRKLREIYVENKSADLLQELSLCHQSEIPAGGLILRDMDNHDTVTDWDGRTETLIGHHGMEQILVLNYLMDGVPMVYCGNELGCTANHSMFANRFYMGKYETTDRTIAKEEYSIRRQNVIRKLNKLKEESDELCYGKTVWLNTSHKDSVVSFERDYNNSKIVFIGNTRNDVAELETDFVQKYTEILIENNAELKKDSVTLLPYGYIVIKIL